MRTLHVVPSLSPLTGGVGTSVRRLCADLKRLGVSTEIWATSKWHSPTDRPADDQLREAGVGLRYFQTHPWRWLGTRYAYSPGMEEALLRDILSFDLVHLHSIWLYTTQAAASACSRFRVPYLVSPCGMLDRGALRIRPLRKLLYGWLIERRTLAGAAAIHFTSPMEQKRAWRMGLRRPGFVVPRSVELGDPRSVSQGAFRTRRPEISEPFLLLFLGRLHPTKRLDILVEAFIRVARRRSDVRLIIAGPDEGSEPSLRAALKKAGLSNRVTFTGLLAGPEKWAALRDSTLLLLPSEFESFAVAALEALASGVPVLLSEQVALSDWVRAAQAGSVLPRDAGTWAEEISRLLNNPALLQAMGEAGRRLAEEEFSGREVARKMLSAYEEILQGAPRK